MPDISKIEAWIQKQDDELLYDVDGEQAYQESLHALDVVTLDGRQGTVSVRFDCSTSGPFPTAVLEFAAQMIDRHSPFAGRVNDRSNSE